MKRALVVLVISLLAGTAGGLACGSEEGAAPSTPTKTPAKPSAAPAPSPAARDEAQQIFGTRCTTCHGPQGAGDGPASAGLSPHPRNFQDAAWQDSVDDEYVERIILYGGAAVGRSPAMPGNPDLSAKPDVVAAIRQHIRSLRQ